MNNEEIKVVHAIPGRMRLKVSKIRQNSAFEAQIRERLSAVKAIQQVEINPATGSVLLLYNPEEITLPDSLFSLWESFGSLFPELDFEDFKPCLLSPNASTGPSTEPTAGRIAELSRTLNERMRKAGSLDLKVLLPIALFTLGIRGLLAVEKVPIPAWYDFLWFSFSTFFILNPMKGRVVTN